MVHLIHGDCAVIMSSMDSGLIDLTVTSPPYDDMRLYNGNYSFDFESVARQLYRITKDGGVVVWVVGDGTKNGTETGTSFRQALYFKEMGFNLLDTMIYHKRAVGAIGSHYAYNQAFEYMFILSKGRNKTFNPIKDLVSKNAGKFKTYAVKQSFPDSRKLTKIKKMSPSSGGKRQNIWTYDVGFGNNDDRTEHPAPFPESLVRDHILSWSNVGDLVLDPFMGSGTTGKVCKLLDRNFIGIDIDSHYIDMASTRIERSYDRH